MTLCCVDILSVNLKVVPEWNVPTCWTGPKDVFYLNFDSSDGLVLMEGSEEVNYTPLVIGKVK